MHDQQMTTPLWVALFSLAVATCVGCTPARILSVIKPAEVSLKGISTLAVLKFDGPSGEIVRSHVDNRLAEVQHFMPIGISQVHALENLTYGQVDNPMFFFSNAI